MVGRVVRRMLASRSVCLLCLSCLALCAAGLVSAREVRDFDFGDRLFESVGSADDIPYGVVTRIVQAPSGLFWIGTQNGLLRFDGYRFRRFVHDPRDASSLSGDFVQSLAVDARGRVWVGTEADGVSVFDPETERFLRYRHQPGSDQGIGPGPIHAITVAPDGAVWIAADVGLVRHDPDTGAFQSWLGERADRVPGPELRVQSLLFDRAGQLWVGTRDGLARVRVGSSALERFRTQGSPALAGKDISTLFEDSGGQLWVGTREHGAARLDPDSGQLHWIGREHAQAEALSQGWVNAIAQPTADEIWLSRFPEGIAIVDRETGSVRHLLRHDPAIPSGLAFDALGVLLVDRSGLLWVGAWGGGLQRHNPRNQAIRLLRHSPTHPHRLSHPSVLRILERRDGRVFVGTTGNGIDIIDRRLGVVGGYRPDPADPDALASGVVSGLAEDAQGRLWVGTYQSGVHRLDPGARGFRRYGREHGLPTLQIEYLFMARDDRLWVGTGDGLLRFDAAADRFVALLDAEGHAPQVRINDIDEDDDGRLWIATSGGLYVVEPGSEVLSHRADVARGLVSDHVASVLVDTRGRVWVDSAKGLQRLLRDADGGERFEDVSARLGMAGESLGGSLQEDAQGRIWSPLYVFDPEAMTIYTLHRADGMDIGAHWIGAAARTRDGHLLFGGSTGLAVVAPERFMPWREDPRVIISGVSIDGREQPLALAERGLRLASTQRRFSVEFGAADFASPQANKYEYRLLGESAQWTEVDAEHRIASFSNLWPGKYVLELRARNRVGDASSAPTRVTVTIDPAWWQTGWFVLAMLLLIVALAFLLVRFSAVRYRRRALGLQVLVDERTRELRAFAQRAELASRTDPLSGLGNRRSIDIDLPDKIAEVQTRRSDGAAIRLAFVVIDIDGFKAINDRLGHRAGDQVIERVGALIAGSLHEGDLAARWGGEEFLIVAAVADEDAAWQRAEALRVAVAATTDMAQPLTVSIGVACLPFDPARSDAPGWEQVVEIADTAMYIAKHEGRNRAYGFHATGPLPENFIERFRRDPEAAPRVLPVALVRITPA